MLKATTATVACFYVNMAHDGISYENNFLLTITETSPLEELVAFAA